MHQVVDLLPSLQSDSSIHRDCDGDGTVLHASSSHVSHPAAALFWRESRAAFRARWGPLYVMYSHRAWYWQSLVLLRRAVFVLVSVVLLQSPAHRYLAFTLLNFVSLLLHQFVHPFADARTNHLETGAYALLVIVSAILTGYQAPYPVSVQVALVVLVVPPALLLVLLIGRHHWRRVRHRLTSFLQRSRSVTGWRRSLAAAPIATADADDATKRPGSELPHAHDHDHDDDAHARITARIDQQARTYRGASDTHLADGGHSRALDVPLLDLH